MSERQDRFTLCIMCFGPDKETQERLLKERKPVEDCPICQGTGGIEVEFQKGLDSNEVVTTGRIGKAGYPIVKVAAEYSK